MKESGKHYAPLALTPLETPEPIEYEARWAPEPFWAFEKKVS
jgi:hypothetical protein